MAENLPFNKTKDLRTNILTYKVKIRGIDPNCQKLSRAFDYYRNKHKLNLVEWIEIILNPKLVRYRFQ
jgi:hypothetical protein